jgi:hypothetical protein
MYRPKFKPHIVGEMLECNTTHNTECPIHQAQQENSVVLQNTEKI